MELGERMALQVFAATGNRESRSATSGLERDLAQQDSRVSKAEEDLQSVVAMAKAKLESNRGAARSGEPCGDREVWLT